MWAPGGFNGLAKTQKRITGPLCTGGGGTIYRAFTIQFKLAPGGIFTFLSENCQNILW